jgi:tetratricopeptide (TPR) repeat protein
LFSLFNIFKKKLPPDPKRRQSDHRKFNRKETKILKAAQKQLEGGNVVATAELLESIGLFRETITILEHNGFIEEAAAVLMRMKIPNRAGVLFARNGRWQQAAQSFRLANMPLEVARCEREAGNYRVAAEIFLEAQRFAEAAECFMELQDYEQAATCYEQSGNALKANELRVKASSW